MIFSNDGMVIFDGNNDGFDSDSGGSSGGGDGMDGEGGVKKFPFSK